MIARLSRIFHIPGLPVGHTHEDIDQAFSVISRALRGVKRDAICLNTREAFDTFLSQKVTSKFVFLLHLLRDL